MFKRFRFAEFIIISCVLHALFMVVVSWPKVKKAPQEVTVDIITAPPVAVPKTVAQNAPVQQKKQTEQLEKQIVEQEEKKSTEEAPDTRFLSAQNQKVEKQTVAKNKGEFRNSKKEAANEKPTASRSWNLAPKINDPLNNFDKIEDEGLKKAVKSGESDPAEKKAELADGSQSDDYLKDVDQGLETLLNAREFKYYSYYNRIRRQLSQHWEPKVKVKLSALFKQGRTIAAATDRITKLIVVLDRGGNLVKVQVLKESGVTDLDEAATEAFQSAAPFPNPPTGIIESDGTVKIRWDFVLES